MSDVLEQITSHIGSIGTKVNSTFGQFKQVAATQSSNLSHIVKDLYSTIQSSNTTAKANIESAVNQSQQIVASKVDSLSSLMQESIEIQNLMRQQLGTIYGVLKTIARDLSGGDGTKEKSSLPSKIAMIAGLGAGAAGLGLGGLSEYYRKSGDALTLGSKPKDLGSAGAGNGATGGATGATGGAPNGAGNGANSTKSAGNSGVGAVTPKGWWTTERQNHAIAVLTKGGVSELGAKGLVSRWTHVESTARGPESVNPHGGAFGIAQWLTPSRLRPIKGNTDFDAQLQYVLKELHSTESAALRALNSAKTAQDAARGASIYERAEHYNKNTGLDDWTAKTAAGMSSVGSASAPDATPTQSPSSSVGITPGGGSSGGAGASGDFSSVKPTTPNTGGPEPQTQPATGQQNTGQTGQTGQNTGQNGRLDAGSLMSIGGSHRLIHPAAQAFLQMKQDAAAQGIKLSVTDSYRDYAAQVAVAKKKGLYSQGGLAATPGRSNHGWGRAVDLDVRSNPAAGQWLQQNASRFGFTTISREPWHWEFKGGGTGGKLNSGTGTKNTGATPNSGTGTQNTSDRATPTSSGSSNSGLNPSGSDGSPTANPMVSNPLTGTIGGGGMGSMPRGIGSMPMGMGRNPSGMMIGAGMSLLDSLMGHMINRGKNDSSLNPTNITSPISVKPTIINSKAAQSKAAEEKRASEPTTKSTTPQPSQVAQNGGKSSTGMDKYTADFFGNEFKKSWADDLFSAFGGGKGSTIEHMRSSSVEHMFS